VASHQHIHHQHSVERKDDAMDLLDRYLQAVKKHLPWKRQDDIIAELRANLESQLEDKEAELGRPLTPAEAEAWLRQLGSPAQVASHYQPQQYLIGPAIFPTYRYVLQLAFAWALVIYSIVTVVQFLAGTPSGTFLLEALLRAPVILMTVAAWVTLVFAVFEFVLAQCPEKCPSFAGYAANWSPSTLPPVEEELPSGKKPRTYANAVAEVIFGFLFLAWLLLIPEHPALLLGPGALYLHISPFQLAPVWLPFFWCVVAVNVVQLAWQCENLWRGRWQRRRPVQRIAMKVFGLVPLTVLLTARDQALVLLKHPSQDQAHYGATVDSINLWVHRSLLLIFVIVVLQLAWEIAQIGLVAYRMRAAIR
jgi:hypothetical protein